MRTEGFSWENFLGWQTSCWENISAASLLTWVSVKVECSITLRWHWWRYHLAVSLKVQYYLALLPCSISLCVCRSCCRIELFSTRASLGWCFDHAPVTISTDFVSIDLIGIRRSFQSRSSFCFTSQFERNPRPNLKKVKAIKNQACRMIRNQESRIDEIECDSERECDKMRDRMWELETRHNATQARARLQRKTLRSKCNQDCENFAEEIVEKGSKWELKRGVWRIYISSQK